ncbi:MAG: hypothetical protein JRJ87_21770 [Deltaproteobacteria bacterium]|nr:hypothetical protein [Deltaproteobacteria bacterium]
MDASVDTAGRFTTRFRVRYQDSDPNLLATPVALLGAMQEAAIEHSEHVERGTEWLLQRSLSWMIVQTRFEILSLPTCHTNLEVITWPSEMGRLLSRREFIINDADEKPVLLGTTLWAFMDTAAKKVTRVPEDVSNAYPVLIERALDKPFRRPEGCDQYQWQNRFPVRRWEIDFNSHVNNLRYLDWMLETVPADCYEAFRVQEVNIRYQKEVSLGQSVLAKTSRLSTVPGGLARFGHIILIEESSEPIASAETIWAPQQSDSTTA